MSTVLGKIILIWIQLYLFPKWIYILRRFREENDITQEQLGVVLGVEKAAISKYENERLSISIESLKTISDHYNKPLNYFLQGLLEEKLKRIPILGVIRAGLPLMVHEKWLAFSSKHNLILR